jgi:hypothetical protein
LAAIVMGMSSRRLVLVVMCVGYFLVLLDVTAVNVALPSIAHDLDASARSLRAVVIGYTIALATLLLPAGTHGDRIGHRPVVLAGLATVGFASLGCGLAPTTDVLVTARIVQGAGAAILLPGTLAIIADTHPGATERARAIALWAAIGSVALPAGPMVGGLLVELFGWRAVFWINVPVVLVASLVVARVAPKGTHATVGAVSARSAFALFRTPAFTSANSIAAIMNFGSVALLFLTSLYLQDVQGRSAAAAGTAMVPATLPLAVVPPLAGRWLARRDCEQPALGEDLLRSEGRVQRTGESAIGSGVEECLDDLLWPQPDVEGGIDVDLELGLATAQCGEHAEGDQLPVAGFQAGPRVDLAESPRHDLVSQLRRDVFQGAHHGCTGGTVDRIEHGAPVVVALLPGCGFLHDLLLLLGWSTSDG